MKYLISTFVVFLTFFGIASAITNIDEIDKWAWNDGMGWVDFYVMHNTQNEVIVTNDRLKGSGVIQSNGDYFSLDCATSPNPEPDENICADSFNYFVSNDSNGNLAGWAWSDGVGWTSFCGNASGGSTYNGTTWVCPASPTYQVIIRDNGTGSRDFSNYAWNDSVGWISFNSCQPACGGIAYKVKTYWGSLSTPQSGDLTSNTIDTCPSGEAICTDGVAYNYILWQGNLNGSSNSVKFQLATSSCENGATDAGTCVSSPGWGGTKTSGDGAFVGPDGFASSFYGNPTTLPAIPTPINNLNHNNKRYYRYKVYLTKSASSPESPVIDDIVINWSL